MNKMNVAFQQFWDQIKGGDISFETAKTIFERGWSSGVEHTSVDTIDTLKAVRVKMCDGVTWNNQDPTMVTFKAKIDSLIYEMDKK